MCKLTHAHMNIYEKDINLFSEITRLSYFPHFIPISCVNASIKCVIHKKAARIIEA